MAPPAAATVALRCTAARALRVAGPVTGRGYAFAPGQPVQAVAVADAHALIATGMFRRA